MSKLKKSWMKDCHEMEATTQYPCELRFSPEDMIKKRDRLVECLNNEEAIELEKKEEMQNFNKRLSGIKRESRQLCNEITKGTENKTTNCKVKYNFKKGLKYIIHPQTDEIIMTMDIDLEDTALREEWEKSKKKKVKEIVLSLPAGKVVEVETVKDEVEEVNNSEEDEQGENE